MIEWHVILANFRHDFFLLFFLSLSTLPLNFVVSRLNRLPVDVACYFGFFCILFAFMFFFRHIISFFSSPLFHFVPTNVEWEISFSRQCNISECWKIIYSQFYRREGSIENQSKMKQSIFVDLFLVVYFELFAPFPTPIILPASPIKVWNSNPCNRL